MLLKATLAFIFTLIFAFAVFAQTETLTNADIIEMSKVGLDKQLIFDKINTSKNNFDTSTNGLIELRKAGVDNTVIKFMMDRTKANTTVSEPAAATGKKVPTPKDALLAAKTVAIEKDSIHPSIQSLEKELMKRPDWRAYNLTIIQYKDAADLFVQIKFVHLSVITHRYTFHIYDQKSGTIIAAGETTSWGSLAENLAREISKKLKAVAIPPPSPVETAKN